MRDKLKMGIIILLISPMGGGKTSYATYLILKTLQMNHKMGVASNTSLNFKNAIYSPFMVFDYAELHDMILLYDDIYAIPNIKSFVNILTCLSRKANLDIIITAQYYTQVERSIRFLCNYEIEVLMKFFDRELYENDEDFEDCELLKINDKIYWKKIDENRDIIEIRGNNPDHLRKYEKKYRNFTEFHENVIDILYLLIKKHEIPIDSQNPIITFEDFLVNVNGLYNTKEKVNFSTDKRILEEILKFSNSGESLDLNLSMFFKNKNTRDKYYKQLIPQVLQK